MFIENLETPEKGRRQTDGNFNVFTLCFSGFSLERDRKWKGRLSDHVISG